MTNLDHLGQSEASDGRAAGISIRIGARVAFDARITSAGLLAIVALVSATLLSTAVIVFAAGRMGLKPR